MTAHELLETGTDTVLVAKRQLVLGYEFAMKQIGLEQSARVFDRRLGLDHPLLEPRLCRAFTTADLCASRFERRQQAAGPENHEVSDALGMFES